MKLEAPGSRSKLWFELGRIGTSLLGKELFCLLLQEPCEMCESLTLPATPGAARTVRCCCHSPQWPPLLGGLVIHSEVP